MSTRDIHYDFVEHSHLCRRAELVRGFSLHLVRTHRAEMARARELLAAHLAALSRMTEFIRLAGVAAIECQVAGREAIAEAEAVLAFGRRSCAANRKIRTAESIGRDIRDIYSFAANDDLSNAAVQGSCDPRHP
jgi:hypothetical protein